MEVFASRLEVSEGAKSPAQGKLSRILPRASRKDRVGSSSHHGRRESIAGGKEPTEGRGASRRKDNARLRSCVGH
ncbi:hypothetical protein PM082_023601 [Marasmius tenuissimus]|nr:hypothetical protein PM082_023601 [Marasmius tenuissimus]